MKLPNDIFKERNFREWAIIHFITKFNLLDDGVVSPAQPVDIDVELKINGKEVDFLAVVDELERQHERMVKKDAKRFFDDHCYDVLEPLDEMIESIRDHMKSKLAIIDIDTED